MGVQLKDENKLEEMADILEEFHKYVPNLHLKEISFSLMAIQEILTIHGFISC